MTEHTIICTLNELSTVIANIEACGAKEIRAKQVDSVKFVITYKVEDETEDTP